MGLDACACMSHPAHGKRFKLGETEHFWWRLNLAGFAGLAPNLSHECSRRVIDCPWSAGWCEAKLPHNIRNADHDARAESSMLWRLDGALGQGLSGSSCIGNFLFIPLSLADLLVLRWGYLPSPSV